MGTWLIGYASGLVFCVLAFSGFGFLAWAVFFTSFLVAAALHVRATNVNTVSKTISEG